MNDPVIPPRRERRAQMREMARQLTAERRKNLRELAKTDGDLYVKSIGAGLAKRTSMPELWATYQNLVDNPPEDE